MEINGEKTELHHKENNAELFRLILSLSDVSHTGGSSSVPSPTSASVSSRSRVKG